MATGPSERVAEIGQIIAAGLTRLRARKSSGLLPEIGESSLHFSPPESGHESRFSPSEAGS